MNEERQFKGVWIPAELWLNKELTLLEKVIFTEIDSLDNDNHCTAGNDYFAEFCNVSTTTISRSINHLEELGLIQELDFNGRVRKLRVKKNCLGKLPKQVKQNAKAARAKVRANNITNKTNNNKTNIKNISTKLVKSKSLYDTCEDMVTLYCKDKPGIYDLLIQYLKLRLEMRDKPLYKNQWKGILNKLDKIHEEEGQSYEDIIQFNIEKGYASFFPVPKYKTATKKKACDKGVDNSKWTEDEMKEIKRWQQEQIAKGEQIEF